MSEREQDYVLGDHQEELERLGLQHRAWRPTVLECWRQAGITRGSRVLDVGAGPVKPAFASAGPRRGSSVSAPAIRSGNGPPASSGSISTTSWDWASWTKAGLRQSAASSQSAKRMLAV